MLSNSFFLALTCASDCLANVAQRSLAIEERVFTPELSIPETKQKSKVDSSNLFHAEQH